MNTIIGYIKKNVRFLVLLGFASSLFIYGLLCFNGVRAAEYMTAANMSGDWGLLFSTANTPPAGNVSASELKKYDAYFIGSTNEKKIYLTFDAGYENGFTPSVLDVLSKHNVKAAFFVVSYYMKSQPDLIKRMAEEGHIVANHTSSHPDMSKISTDEAFLAELEPVETLYKEITGTEMAKYYRPPQGKFCVENLEAAKRLGYKTVFWSLAYADWDNNSQPSHEYAKNKLNSRIHNGAVVLLHLTSQTNSEILDELLTGWEAMGYTFGTLDELTVD